MFIKYFRCADITSHPYSHCDNFTSDTFIYRVKTVLANDVKDSSENKKM